MHHRGPDACNTFVNHRIGMGHQRLKIIDLSENANQPMFDKANSVGVIFNGEIYNYKKIQQELTNNGVAFETNSDTEVILEAYKKHGINCLELFNGMFSFIIYDLKKDRIFIARDRLGIKPLFYTISNNQLIASSEINPIVNHPNVKKEPSILAISNYLSCRYPLSDLSFYDNIHSLKPGHYIEITNNNIKHHQYWAIPTPDYENYNQANIENIHTLLTDSVSMRMISDVPLGSFLSGGLDSSLLVALMKSENINTYNISFESNGFNEEKFASLVAELTNSQHHNIKQNTNNYFSDWQELIEIKKLPLAVINEASIFCLSKILKEKVTVVLSGEGADELFAGYGRIFQSYHDFERLNAPLPFIHNAIRKKYKEQSIESFSEFFLHHYSYLSINEKNNYLIQPKNDWLINFMDSEFNKLNDFDYADQINHMMIKHHLPGLLHRLDGATMAASVEGRVPFLDHKLVEYMARTPAKTKIKWKSKIDEYLSKFKPASDFSEVNDIPKYLLKKIAEAYLPTNIIHRKKMGFPVPVHEWFSNEKYDWIMNLLCSKKSVSKDVFHQQPIKELIESNKNAPMHAKGLKLWMLCNIELWLRKN